MYAIDFEYDGQYLSDYGFIVCSFDSSSGTNIVDAGSKITFNKVPHHRGKQYSLASTQYDTCIQAIFDICKNPEEYDKEEMVITSNEYRDLMRWLNRNEFLKFHVFYDDDERDVCYFNVSFNIEKIYIGELLYGLRLTLESDRPFGYGQEQSDSYNFINTSSSFIFHDSSDEIGSTYPFVTITCHTDGNLKIHNELENCTTYIKNCKAGEVITLDGELQIITSTYNSHDICNDFNYEFLRIGNTFQTRSNRITVSLPCEINIRYSPIIKETP